MIQINNTNIYYKMQEEYKVIKGYENYSVSNFWNVRNDLKRRILKQSNHNKGYKVVALDYKLYLVHMLVANAFIANPGNKQCVDHIDNDRSNNRIDNLRLATFSENQYNRII